MSRLTCCVRLNCNNPFKTHKKLTISRHHLPVSEFTTYPWSPGNNEELVRFTFSIYDLNSDGYIR